MTSRSGTIAEVTLRTHAHSTTPPRDRIRSRARGVGSLYIALWGIPTFLFVEPTAGERAIVGVLLCIGPLSGWISTAAHGQLLGALPMLVWATICCVVPLAVAVLRRSALALALFALLWFACGHLFTIAIWI